MIQTGDSPEMVLYRGIVLRLAKHYTNSNGTDFQDLVSAGFEGMYTAISTYDKNRGASLGTHIFIHARKKIQVEKNSQNLIKMSVPTSFKHPVTLTGLESVPEQSYTNDPLDNLIQQEDELKRARKYKQLLFMLNRKISIEHRRIVIDSLIHGLSIAKLKLKYHRKDVYSIIQQAVAIIKGGLPSSSSGD